MDSKKFVHLHNHSEFSLLDGLSKTFDMAKRAKELGHTAIALTDHGTAAGLTAFYQDCVKVGIKPILGFEAYITPMGHTRFEREQYDVKELRGKPGHQSNRYHIILLAKNLKGYQNLCALTTASFSEGYYYKPRIDMDLLREHSEGLICSSACILGEVQHHLFCHDYDKAKEVALAYQDIFGDDFYMEIMNHGLDMEIQVMQDIRRLAKEIGAKVIATNDTHFVYAEDHKLQKTMMLLGMHKSWADDDVDGYFYDEDDVATDREYEDEGGESDPIFSMPSALYLKDYDEMLEVLAIEGGEDGVAEQELANTLEIEEKCNCELPLIDPMDMSAYHTPIYDIPGDEQYAEYAKEDYEIPQVVSDAIIVEMKDDGREGEVLSDFLNQHELESTRFLCWMCEKGIRELVLPKIEAKGNPLPTEFWCENPPNGLKIAHAHNSPDELWIKEQLDNGLSEDDIIQLYYARFSEEMAIVLRKGFCDYFLIVQSYVNYSRFAGATVGPGRGSGAGSLLNYLIGITAVDPLPNGLLFSRFLAKKRVGYPDIDCDFSKEFRDNELKPYLKKVYGDDCASAVATLMMYWGKAAIKAAGRVLFNPPMSVDYANELCELVDDAPKLDLNTQLDKNEDGSWVNPAFVEKMNSTKEHKQIVDLALKLQGHISGESIHASAYILSPHPITDKLPLSVSKDERKRAQETGEPINDYIIQYDGTVTQENWGYVKLDLLAIVDLAMADHAMKTIERVYGCKINIENIPLDDKATFDLLLEGYNSGIFQFDGSPVAIRILTASGANSISDWSAINALNRPGPLQMGYDVEFINGKKHPEQVTYFAPVAEKFLKETYGATCVTGDTKIYCENNEIVPISDIKPGVKVLSDDGKYHLVSNWFDQGMKNTVKIHCDFGEDVICTPDHRVLTDKGWKQAQQLNKNDLIKAFCSSADFYENVWARVLSVKPEGVKQVYDIQVEDTHNFCGNGLILHNCFQEQLMLLSQEPEIVGFDETEADHLRKVTAKKKKDQLAALRVEIEERAKENGVAPEIYETFADIAIAAGSYSFNKSHALAYAIIAYRNAFLKTHFPECFLASMCTFKPMQKKKNKIPGYLEEARQFGLTVKPPHVNYSMEGFDVPERGVIAFGLSGIKKVGKAAAPIIAEREANGPYKDFTDFCVRVPRTVGKQPLEALIKAGALDNLGWTRMAMEESIEQIVQFRKDYFADKEKKAKFSDDLFGGFFAGDTFDADPASSAAQNTAPAVELVPPFDTEYSEKQLMRKEKENFEMYLSRDPRDFSRVSRYITECEMEDEASRPENKASLGYKYPMPINISQVPDLADKTLVQFVANVTDCRQFYTKKGDPMASMFVWDNGADEASRFGFSPTKSTLKCTLFPKTWKTCIRPMPDDVVHVIGRISKDPEGRYADAVLVDSIEVIPEDSSWTNKSTPIEKVYEFKAAMDEMLARDEALGDPSSPKFLIPAITFKTAEDLEAFKNDPELEDRFHDPRGHVQVMVEGDDKTIETLNLKQTVGLVKFALREYHGIAKKVRWNKAQRALDRRSLLTGVSAESDSGSDDDGTTDESIATANASVAAPEAATATPTTAETSSS